MIPPGGGKGSEVLHGLLQIFRGTETVLGAHSVQVSDLVRFADGKADRSGGCDVDEMHVGGDSKLVTDFVVGHFLLFVADPDFHLIHFLSFGSFGSDRGADFVQGAFAEEIAGGEFEAAVFVGDSFDFAGDVDSFEEGGEGARFIRFDGEDEGAGFV